MHGSIVITEHKEVCILILSPSLHHESSADCERGRKVFLLYRGVREAVVLVGFLIALSSERSRAFKGLQSGSEQH